VEILLIAEDRNGYVVGDIIAINPDGFEWGREEYADPLFDIISVPDAQMGGSVTAARAQYLHQLEGPRIAPEDTDNPEAPGRPNLLRRSRFRFQGRNLREATRGGTDSAPIVNEIHRRQVTRTRPVQPVARKPREVRRL